MSKAEQSGSHRVWKSNPEIGLPAVQLITHKDYRLLDVVELNGPKVFFTSEGSMWNQPVFILEPENVQVEFDPRTFYYRIQNLASRTSTTYRINSFGYLTEDFEKKHDLHQRGYNSLTRILELCKQLGFAPPDEPVGYPELEQDVESLLNPEGSLKLVDAEFDTVRWIAVVHNRVDLYKHYQTGEQVNKNRANITLLKAKSGILTSPRSDYPPFEFLPKLSDDQKDYYHLSIRDVIKPNVVHVDQAHNRRPSFVNIRELNYHLHFLDEKEGKVLYEKLSSIYYERESNTPIIGTSRFN